MAQQLINIGTTANDGTGDPLRTAFNKINTNFTEVYSNITAAVEVSADTTPQLGGNLVVGGFSIVSTSNGNIRLDPNGTGFVILDSLRVNTRTLSSNVANQPLLLRGNGTAGVNMLNIDVTDGHMDNVIIGGNIAAAGSFTTLSSTGNSTVGGNLSVTGNASVTGTSTLTGNVTASGTRNYISGELRQGTNVDSPYAVSFSDAIANQGDGGIFTDDSVRLHLQSADNNLTRLLMESVGTLGGSMITAKHSNGTAAAPTHVETSDNLLRIQARGYNGSAWTGARAEIRFQAAENWSTTDNGAYISFYTTPFNSNVMVRSAVLSSFGNLQIDGQLTVSGTGLSRIGGSCQIDEMLIETGEISSLVTDGDIFITPNGSGRVVINGEMSVMDSAVIDELSINNSNISSTTTNSDITVSPNGTGKLVVDSDITVNGTASIDSINVGANAIENTASNGGLSLIPNGTGKVSVFGQLRLINANFPTSSVGQLGDQEGDVAVTSGYFYYCTGNYDGSTDIWKRVAWDVGTW